MLIQSQKVKINTMNEARVDVVYNLIFKNALYSLECLKLNGNKQNSRDYCFVENITEDEGEAEVFLQLMRNGMVLPVHISDLVEDYFN